MITSAPLPLATQSLVPRQTIGTPTTTVSPSTFTSSDTSCTPTLLPASGVLMLGHVNMTLKSNALFNPECTGYYYANIDYGQVITLPDPFYASAAPQAYVLSAATIISWVLVIILLINPTASLANAASTGTSVLGGRGLLRRTPGRTSVVKVGSRPWLQKLAALLVAIALTIASGLTMSLTKEQYYSGASDALGIRDSVARSFGILVIGVISDVFVRLAQVQTLIRLFPRHREKIMIKWIGFSLIIMNTIFGCLDDFYYKSTARYGTFTDAIPALNYLFVLALNLLYAAWVLFYALTKRTYAFYHSRMPNIALVALMSILVIVTPIVFFVADISNTQVSSWGDYFQWAGGVAASVVVWEWVERIEAVETEDRKDGILGREIFEEDEVPERSGSEKDSFTLRRKTHNSDNSSSRGQSPTLVPTLTSAVVRLPRTRFGARRTLKEPQTHSAGSILGNVMRGSSHGSDSPVPGRHPAAATPISRTDTTSPGSTVYTVQYRTIQGPATAREALSLIASHTETPQENHLPRSHRQSANLDQDLESGSREGLSAASRSEHRDSLQVHRPSALPGPFLQSTGQRLQSLMDRMRGKLDAPPAEVARAAAVEPNAPRIESSGILQHRHDDTQDSPERATTDESLVVTVPAPGSPIASPVTLPSRTITFLSPEANDVASPSPRTSTFIRPRFPKPSILTRIGPTMSTKTASRRKGPKGESDGAILPTFVIPAQPRGRTWSPGTLSLPDEPAIPPAINGSDEHAAVTVDGGLADEQSSHDLDPTIDVDGSPGNGASHEVNAANHDNDTTNRPPSSPTI